MKRVRTFGEKVKRKLYEKRMNYNDLAKIVGVAPSTIATYINGAIRPNINRIEQIAKALDCSIYELEEDLDTDDYELQNTPSLRVTEAARIMGVSDMFLRMALRNGVAPFGFAFNTGKQWCYHISAKQFFEWIGEKHIEKAKFTNIEQYLRKFYGNQDIENI